ncbi:MAG: hypothetical protein QM621_08145 [Aeromicrobium sp.]|uniref:hypothetical protein n=1 Tax=Aeromicrobium sp. TaxID=1871063 RepID=UPI0039E4CCC5
MRSDMSGRRRLRALSAATLAGTVAVVGVAVAPVAVAAAPTTAEVVEDQTGRGRLTAVPLQAASTPVTAMLSQWPAGATVSVVAIPEDADSGQPAYFTQVVVDEDGAGEWTQLFEVTATTTYVVSASAPDVGSAEPVRVDVVDDSGVSLEFEPVGGVVGVGESVAVVGTGLVEDLLTPVLVVRDSAGALVGEQALAVDGGLVAADVSFASAGVYELTVEVRLSGLPITVRVLPLGQVTVVADTPVDPVDPVDPGGSGVDPVDPGGSGDGAGDGSDSDDGSSPDGDEAVVADPPSFQVLDRLADQSGQSGVGALGWLFGSDLADDGGGLVDQLGRTPDASGGDRDVVEVELADGGDGRRVDDDRFPSAWWPAVGLAAAAHVAALGWLVLGRRRREDDDESTWDDDESTWDDLSPQDDTVGR